MSIRIQRINELLKEEVSQVLLKEMNFSNCLVTITEVDASSNLSNAKVKISVLPQSKTDVILKKLNKNIYQIQQKINRKLNMRPVPKLIFIVDKVSQQAQRVEDILHKIKQDKKA